jgi:hypothetical protein
MSPAEMRTAHTRKRGAGLLAYVITTTVLWTDRQTHGQTDTHRQTDRQTDTMSVCGK